jgi:hypothetical protein
VDEGTERLRDGGTVAGFNKIFFQLLSTHFNPLQLPSTYFNPPVKVDLKNKVTND